MTWRRGREGGGKGKRGRQRGGGREGAHLVGVVLSLEELGPLVPLMDVVRVLSEKDGGQLWVGREGGREGRRGGGREGGRSEVVESIHAGPPR